MGTTTSKNENQAQKDDDDDEEVEQYSKHEIVVNPYLEIRPELLQLKSCRLILHNKGLWQK